MQTSVEDLRARFEASPNSRAFAPLAEAYHRVGQIETAIELLQRGTVHHPDYVSAIVLLAECYHELSREDEAAVMFARVLELDPDNLVALRFRAERALKLGASSQARGILERMLEIDPFFRGTQELRRKLEQVQTSPQAGEASSRHPVPHRPQWSGPTAAPQDAPLAPTPPSPGTPAVPGGRTHTSEPGRQVPEGNLPPASPAGAQGHSEPSPPMTEAEPPSGAASGGAHAPLEPKSPELSRGPFRSLHEGVTPDPPAAPPAAESSDEFSTLTLAGIYESQGYLEKALSIYDELVRQHPNHPEIKERLKALQRRLSGVDDSASIPARTEVNAPERRSVQPDPEWGSLRAGELHEEAGEAVRRLQESTDRSRQRQVQPPQEPLSRPAQASTREDYERFLRYVRSLKR